MYPSNVLSSDLFISASSRRVVPSRCRYLLPPTTTTQNYLGTFPSPPCAWAWAHVPPIPPAHSKSIQYLPMRARNNLVPQEAARTFTRTCTHCVARNSCCKMAYNCPSGGECPPRPTQTTRTRHPRNDTFCNGKPNILRRVNVRVNVCYLEQIQSF